MSPCISYGQLIHESGYFYKYSISGNDIEQENRNKTFLEKYGTEKPNQSKEYREKQRIAQTGKKRKDTTKRLLRDAANRRWQNPEFKKHINKLKMFRDWNII